MLSTLLRELRPSTYVATKVGRVESAGTWQDAPCDNRRLPTTDDRLFNIAQMLPVRSYTPESSNFTARVLSSTDR